MKKLTISIADKLYTLSFEDEEYEDLKKEAIDGVFSLEGDNDIKNLLLGYFKKSHEIVKMKKELQAIVEKLERV